MSPSSSKLLFIFLVTAAFRVSVGCAGNDLIEWIHKEVVPNEGGTMFWKVHRPIGLELSEVMSELRNKTEPCQGAHGFSLVRDGKGELLLLYTSNICPSNRAPGYEKEYEIKYSCIFNKDGSVSHNLHNLLQLICRISRHNKKILVYHKVQLSIGEQVFIFDGNIWVLRKKIIQQPPGFIYWMVKSPTKEEEKIVVDNEWSPPTGAPEAGYGTSLVDGALTLQYAANILIDVPGHEKYVKTYTRTLTGGFTRSRHIAILKQAIKRPSDQNKSVLNKLGLQLCVGEAIFVEEKQIDAVTKNAFLRRKSRSSDGSLAQGKVMLTKKKSDDDLIRLEDINLVKSEVVEKIKLDESFSEACLGLDVGESSKQLPSASQCPLIPASSSSSGTSSSRTMDLYSDTTHQSENYVPQDSVNQIMSLASQRPAEEHAPAPKGWKNPSIGDTACENEFHI